MADTQTAPYGAWESPITASMIAGGNVRLGELDMEGSTVYWTESRPTEKGRNVLVRWAPNGERQDITPPPYNVRTRVHEYGGGAFAVRQGVVYFSNFADQQIYRQGPGESPVAVTPVEQVRYADGVFAPNGRFICIREDHRAPGEPVNTIVSVALDGKDIGRILASGKDFYSTPRLNPDGTRLAWLAWNHSNMPWDGTELFVGTLGDDGALHDVELVAGGPDESIFQPEWSPSGALYFVSDRSNWWNLYSWRDGETRALHPMEAEFGLPQWMFGRRTYAFAGPHTIICTYIENGTSYLGRLDTENGRFTPYDLPFTLVRDVCVDGDYVVFQAGSPTLPASFVRLNWREGRYEILRSAQELEIDERYLSRPRTLEYSSGNGRIAHAFYYPPHNGDFTAPPDELPPLVVKSHGGPTGMTTATLTLGVQYWTSRGFGVLDVNYRGSTGYGRAYRRSLYGQWGIADVEDCINGARNLADQGEVDPARMAITGGSAGGFTTLCALTFHDLFSAGASHFGVSDVELLAKETHKFESHYLDNLIGPYPEQRDLYLKRSPIHHVDQLDCALILFQGLDDPVVPPSQAQQMYEAVKSNGKPVAYLAFEGEQHGFRQAENIQRALEAELYFYGKVFGFEPANEIDSIRIANLRA